MFAMLPFALLIGCGVDKTTPVISNPTLPLVTGNWQIQSSTGAPNAGILLVGSLTAAGTQVAGVLRFTDLASANTCGPAQQPLQFTGTIDLSQNISLTATTASGAVVTVNLLMDAGPNAFGYGTLLVTGESCNYPLSRALGANIAMVAGTFNGSVSAVGSLQSQYTGLGTLTLNLIQSTQPLADGQYSVSGTFQFSSGTCNDSGNVTGLLSGASFSLSSTSNDMQATGGIDNTADQLSNVSTVFSAGLCSTTIPAYDTYSGSLTKN